jgi:hypothetical protein
VPTRSLVNIAVTFGGDLSLLTLTAQNLFKNEALTELVTRINNGATESDALSTTLASGSIVFSALFPQTAVPEATAQATVVDIQSTPLQVSLNGAMYASTGASSDPDVTIAPTFAPTHVPTTYAPTIYAPTRQPTIAPSGLVPAGSSGSGDNNTFVILMSVILVLIIVAIVVVLWRWNQKQKFERERARINRGGDSGNSNNNNPSRQHFNPAFHNPLIVNSPSPSRGSRTGGSDNGDGNELMGGYRAPQSPGGVSASSWMDADRNYIEMDSVDDRRLYTTTTITDETTI